MTLSGRHMSHFSGSIKGVSLPRPAWSAQPVLRCQKRNHRRASVTCQKTDVEWVPRSTIQREAWKEESRKYRSDAHSQDTMILARFIEYLICVADVFFSLLKRVFISSMGRAGMQGSTSRTMTGWHTGVRLDTPDTLLVSWSESKGTCTIISTQTVFLLRTVVRRT